MEVPWPQCWALGLLLFFLPRSWGAESRLSLLYHLTAVTNPAPHAPAFWASGWLGPQQYLSYSSLRPMAEPCGAWTWENQVPWYWEKETTDLRSKEKLFKDALRALGRDSQVLQGLLGCELANDNSSVPTAIFALNGEEFMRFDPRTSNWTGNWPETLTIGQLWRQQADTPRKEREFLLSSCPRRLLGHLELGRGNLEWKEPPSMRLKARPSSPGFSVLTCSAFSFHPPELQLRFLRNGMAAGVGNTSGFSPNGDGSFHAWSSLTVKRGDEHHYQCLVMHKGLPHPLLVSLEPPAKASVPVAGIVLGLLVFMAAAVAGGVLLWWRMRRGLSAPWIFLRGDDDESLLPTPSLPQDAIPQDINASA
ncbi:IgG receptor FcRn large subunit p51 isoform X2 [Perognathus longimembris pacificus]|nr:IgG receptor FcRn large subunit p51 isoform X2 [Perognathus longimembris pacificus]